MGESRSISAYANLTLRVVVGAVYLFQAYLALFAATPKGLAAHIEKLGFQAHTILAVGVIATNGIGGAMLIIGVWTRLAGSLNAAVLLLGLLTVYVRQSVLLKGTLVDAAIGRNWLATSTSRSSPPPRAGRRGRRRRGRQEVTAARGETPMPYARATDGIRLTDQEHGHGRAVRERPVRGKAPPRRSFSPTGSAATPTCGPPTRRPSPPAAA